MRGDVFFRFFLITIAVPGAIAEWAVACWLLAGYGIVPGAVWHLVAPALLLGLNVLGSRSLTREPAYGVLSGAGGRLVLAVSFTSVIGVAALGAAAAACVALRFVEGFRAEAEIVGAGASDGLLGLRFRLLGSIALGLTTSVVTYGYTFGYRRLVVTRVDVPVAGLPPALAGFRIVHVTDLHLGPIADRAAIRDALHRATALDGDLVCVTGDIVDCPGTDLDAWLPELTRLDARRGVMAILGNHDRHIGLDRVAAALTRATPWRLLRDEVATVTVGDARLHVAGLEDRPFDVAGEAIPDVLAPVPDGEPVVLLAHNPGVFPLAAACGANLTLAGHTHGGQVAMPGLRRLNIARILMTRFDAGTFTHEGAVLHVNRGLGASGQRVRIGVPREITVLRLVPA